MEQYQEPAEHCKPYNAADRSGGQQVMRRTHLLTLSFLLAGLASGCAASEKSASPSYAGAEAVAYGGGYGGSEGGRGDYAMEESMAMDDAYAGPMEAKRSMARSEIAAPPQEPPSADASGPVVPADPADPAASGGESEPDPQTDPEDHGRQIIYTASMQVSVYNLSEGMKAAEKIPETYGGYIFSRSEGQLVLKIPAAKLRTVMDELGKLGRVDTRNLQAQDVTAEFTDLESRIKVLEETQKQLLALLKQAKSVKDALAVRDQLDRITMELEVAKGRMRQLSNLISFSTLTVILAERGPYLNTPSENDPFPWVDSLGVEATEWN